MNNYYEIKGNDMNCKKFPMVLYFTASWCGPCKKISPSLEILAKKYSDISVVKIDIDENNELSLLHNIDSVPTFIFYKKKGDACKILKGSDLKTLEKYFKYILEL